jgi:hypothetical protein
MEGEIALSRLLAALEDGRQRAEDLADPVLPSSVSERWELDDEGVLTSVVADHRDASEAEPMSSTELDDGREAGNLGEIVVVVDVLQRREDG